jgi:hypothetical protein
VTTRVLPSETIRAEIEELIAGAERGSLLEHFEEVARAAVRLVFQTARPRSPSSWGGTATPAASVAATGTATATAQ